MSERSPGLPAHVRNEGSRGHEAAEVLWVLWVLKESCHLQVRSPCCAVEVVVSRRLPYKPAACGTSSWSSATFVERS
jgi:hypothetical protein